MQVSNMTNGPATVRAISSVLQTGSSMLIISR
jgi:hypothetical protein